MSIRLKYLIGIPYLFLLLCLLQTTTALSDNHCQLYQNNTILDCSNLDAFPSGPYESVKTIKFSRNNLTELKSYVFVKHNLSNLETAILRLSNIKLIHSNAFVGMPELTYLDLYGNDISNIEEKSFSGLPSLKYLVLSKNQIITIDEIVFKPLVSLEMLDLSFNRIKSLSSTFLKYSNISELRLSNNSIVLPKEAPILESSSLVNLALRSCALKELHQKSFSKLVTLAYLDLSKNRLKVLPANLFKPLKHLKSIDLGSNFINHLDVKVLPIPNDIDYLVCNENPLEKSQNCTEILYESKNSSSDINETTSTTQNLQPTEDIDIEQLQYWMLIGFSIALMILIVIIVCQAFYIVRQHSAAVNVKNIDAHYSYRSWIISN